MAYMESINNTYFDKVYQAVDEFFKCYFTQRDIEKTLALVTDEVYSIGTGAGEIARNKSEFEALLKAEISNMPNQIFYEINDFESKDIGCCASECFCNMDVRAPIVDGGMISYAVRLTITFVKENGRMLASTFHVSVASVYQHDDEFFPLRYCSNNCEDTEINWRSQHEIAQIICETIPGGILGGYINENYPVYVVNDNLLNMLGYTYEEFMSITDGNIVNIIHPDDKEKVIAKVSQDLSVRSQCDAEMRIRKKDGSFMWVYAAGKEITVKDGRKAIISVIVDFSENVKRLSSLEEENIRDSLTGLYNRKGGEKFIVDCLHNCGSFIFVMMDIDNFKGVNDAYVHYEGDKILKYVADLLHGVFRKTDIIFRIGGDEFGIFIRNCTDGDAIYKKLNKVINEYRDKIITEYPKSESSISFGGVICNKAVSFTSMYKAADKVLYHVKSTQKGICLIKPM